MNEFLFPHEKIRPAQDIFINKAIEAFKNKSHLIAHAPTGIGKTSVIGPALSYALEKNLKVFFLTSRHTQHNIAIETLKQIREKYDTKFLCSDLIGKKWMCSNEGMLGLNSGDFSELCKNMRKDNSCEPYYNTRSKGKFTEIGKNVLNQIEEINPCSVDRIVEYAQDEKLCAYEVGMELAKKANIIITDYFYLFSSRIRDNFFKKIGAELENSIFIIDEGHNLPLRIRDLMSVRLSTNMLIRAVKEARKYKFSEALSCLVTIQDAMNKASKDLRTGQETMVSKNKFIDLIVPNGDIDEVIEELEFAANSIKDKQKQSYISGIALFLNNWLGEDEGYTRIMSMVYTPRGDTAILNYKCLDPSVVTRAIINSTHSTVLMSGTLSPTKNYYELLGFPTNTKTVALESPFPKENRLNLIVPKTSTKYSARSKDQFKKIAECCADVVNNVPGNSIVFFPSYFLLNEINSTFKKLYNRPIFTEKQKMLKEDKDRLLRNFKKESEEGACLLAVSSANFSEGVDFPGDMLKAVVVVGLPLQKPDLETKQLISYYDHKFGNGWDLGYVFPAFTKTLQMAGRCIRNEKDKGIIVFLDERYAWSNYKKHFPNDWEMTITPDFVPKIKEFYQRAD